MSPRVTNDGRYIVFASDRDGAMRGWRMGLSEREGRLLRYFIDNRGETVTRDMLLRDVWGYNASTLTRTVDVHILRLRQKIEDDPRNPRFIVTIHGIGYRFDG